MDLESMLETKAVVHEAQYDVALASFYSYYGQCEAGEDRDRKDIIPD